LRGSRLDFVPDRLPPSPTFVDIGLYLFAVPEIVGEDRVDIIEMEDGEVLRDLLWCGSGLEEIDYGIQSDAGPRDPKDTPLVGAKRNRPDRPLVKEEPCHLRPIQYPGRRFS